MIEGDPRPAGDTLIEGVAWGNEFDAARESWRKRHRENNIERMAKAVWLVDARLQFGSANDTAWPFVDQAHYRALAEAAYDAL